MFGSNDSKKKQSNGKAERTPSNPNALNSIVNGTKIEGNISSDNDIRIDGVLSGSLKVKGKVIIGPHGKVEGEIYCEQSVVEGSFEGTLKVKDTLQVKESAKIQGEVATQKLVVQSGAVFNVTCKMGEQIVRERSGKAGKAKEEQLASKANS